MSFGVVPPETAKVAPASPERAVSSNARMCAPHASAAVTGSAYDLRCALIAAFEQLGQTENILKDGIAADNGKLPPQGFIFGQRRIHGDMLKHVIHINLDHRSIDQLDVGFERTTDQSDPGNGGKFGTDSRSDVEFDARAQHLHKPSGEVVN